MNIAVCHFHLRVTETFADCLYINAADKLCEEYAVLFSALQKSIILKF